ncbi:uncharacterized protein [Amphiura filiformis]|uniref:uncharacterized protein n=1 Tax=Amphiura filiformis TaxID=82378 RepID=UPI003B224BBC
MRLIYVTSLLVAIISSQSVDSTDPPPSGSTDTNGCAGLHLPPFTVPCLNGDTCTEGSLQYTCQCGCSWTENVQVSIQTAAPATDACTPNPCPNGALCFGTDTYTCEMDY